MKTKLQISVRRTVAVCLAAAGASLAQAGEEVLWWQVPDDATVATFHQGDVSASSLGVTGARIITSAGEYLVIPPPDMESIEVPMVAGAWFAILPDSPEGLSFMVELGNWEDGQWVGIAQSRSYAFSALESHIVHDWSGPGAIPALAPWVADGYVVPEPSSGLLLLIGGGLLALRRKRRA